MALTMQNFLGYLRLRDARVSSSPLSPRESTRSVPQELWLDPVIKVKQPRGKQVPVMTKPKDCCGIIYAQPAAPPDQGPGQAHGLEDDYPLDNLLGYLCAELKPNSHLPAAPKFELKIRTTILKSDSTAFGPPRIRKPRNCIGLIYANPGDPEGKLELRYATEKVAILYPEE